MTLTEENRVPITELVPLDGAHLHHRFLDYWLKLHAAHAMPSYADIDAVDFPWALANIFVVEILPGGDFVYRIAGEEHTERYRRNLKGMRLSDIMEAAAADAITELWRQMLEVPAALFILTDHQSEPGTSVLGDRLLLPLGNDRKTPTHLVGITNFFGTSTLAGALTGDQKVKCFRWSRVEPEHSVAQHRA